MKCKEWYIDDHKYLIISVNLSVNFEGEVIEKTSEDFYYNIMWTTESNNKITPDDLLKYIAKCKDEKVRKVMKNKLKEIL